MPARVHIPVFERSYFQSFRNTLETTMKAIAEKGKGMQKKTSRRFKKFYLEIKKIDSYLRDGGILPYVDTDDKFALLNYT